MKRQEIFNKNKNYWKKGKKKKDKNNQKKTN